MMTPEHKAALAAGRAKARATRIRSAVVSPITTNGELPELVQDTLRRHPRFAKLFRKAFTGKSLSASKKAHCLWCSNFDISEVKDCLVVSCPLWLYRPYQAKEGEGT